MNFGHGNKSKTQKKTNTAGMRKVPTIDPLCKCFSWNGPL